ncbi:MAG: efflux RND transporter periplasmic adaptor subunit [Acidobacteriota bacterium]|nr:efflux RND transporter periplasmic adaptor subunit [Acidobacteriota bacterium]
MSRARKWTLGAIALSIGGVVLYGITANGASTNIDPSRLATAERGPIVRSVVATGKVEPITKVEIKSKANGIIERLASDVDHQVEAGQILAELDKENLRARLREARANLEAARAAQTAAEAQVAKSEIEAEAPDVAFAKSAYERARSLNEQQLVSQESLDLARNTYEQALNRQRASGAQLLIGRAKVNEARAQVAQASAAVERAEEELANATIRAPIHGTVLTRDVEVGSPVSSILNLGASATLVMTLGDIQQVFVRGKVDEADIGLVKLGMPARITTESFKDKVFHGNVTQISPIGVEKDNVTTFEVEVSIDNPGHELKANMTANAEIVLEEHTDVLVIPEAAITYDAERNASVELADPTVDRGRRRVPIKVGIGTGTRTEVLEGLKSGDRVILPG